MKQNRASSTALVVAAGLLLRRADPRTRSLVDTRAALHARAALRRAGTFWRALAFVAGARWGVPFLFGIERAMLPGLTTHHCLRKAWVEDRLRETATGCTQVIVLGAGLDGLGARLAARGWRVVEVDHPATLALGRHAAATPAANHRTIAADLANELPALASLDSSAPTAVVAEGLLMYLDLARVREVLGWLRETLAPESVLILSYMQPDERGRPRFRGQHRGVAWWLRHRHEPFKWALTPQELEGLLTGAGFRTIQHRSAAELRDEYLPYSRVRIAEGENLVLAKREDQPSIPVASISRSPSRYGTIEI